MARCYRSFKTKLHTNGLYALSLTCQPPGRSEALKGRCMLGHCAPVIRCELVAAAADGVITTGHGRSNIFPARRGWRARQIQTGCLMFSGNGPLKSGERNSFHSVQIARHVRHLFKKNKKGGGLLYWCRTGSGVLRRHRYAGFLPWLPGQTPAR